MSNKKFYVIGVQRSQGNYQGHDYDNAVIFVGADCSGTEGEFAGHYQSDRVKVPWKMLNDQCEFGLTEIVGRYIRVLYDRYGRPSDFEFLEDEI